MKAVMYVDHEQLAGIREDALHDEMMGLDPGARWARLYPGASELEFVVRDAVSGDGQHG